MSLRATDGTIAPARQHAFAAAFSVLLLTGLLLNIGVRPLEFEEPRRALVAMEMGLQHQLAVPTTNGTTYLNKPPVFNWVLLGFIRAAGSTDEWVLRLPTVLSLLCTGLALGLAAHRYLGKQAARIAPVLYFTFPILLFYGTLYGEMDIFYSLVVTLQALAIFELEQRGRPVLLFLCSYLLAAIGFLVKGVPSLFFQGLTLFAWLWHVGRARWILSWAHAAGVAVAAACIGGYLAAYSRLADPVPFLSKLVLEAAARTFAGDRHSLPQLALHLAAFPADFLVFSAPWSVILLPALVAALRRRWLNTPFVRFCTVFIAVNVIPYWLSPGTRPRYQFMFLPFVAGLLAVAAEELAWSGDGTAGGETGNVGRWRRWLEWYGRSMRATVAVTLALAALAAAFIPFTPLATHLSHPVLWWVATACVAALAVVCWKARADATRLAALVLALCFARIGYDVLVPQYRRAHSEHAFSKEVAHILSREFADPIQLLGHDRDARISVLGMTVHFQEHEWFSMSLSYYYTAERHAILSYASRPEPGRLYLAHAGFALQRPHRVLRFFDYPDGDADDLKLVRVLE